MISGIKYQVQRLIFEQHATRSLYLVTCNLQLDAIAHSPVVKLQIGVFVEILESGSLEATSSQ